MNQPRYFPFLHGVYDVKAGIMSLARDHGNGAVDGRVFQFDDCFEGYRQSKLDAVRHADRHVLRYGLLKGAEVALAQWVADRLVAEHPAYFSWCDEKSPRGGLRCARTNEVVELGNAPHPLDALALQVQCDWAVLQMDDEGRNRLSLLHVTMPSGWCPEEKIGQPFDAVHTPVPHIEPISAKQDSVAKLMVNATRGAVRFAWTITTDPALNHHPLAVADGDVSARASADLPGYVPGDPLLRVERQVIWGFPKHRAALFTIRTYRYTLADLDAATRSALSAAVAGMSDASLRYKNMDPRAILAWLGVGDGGF